MTDQLSIPEVIPRVSQTPTLTTPMVPKPHISQDDTPMPKSLTADQWDALLQMQRSWCSSTDMHLQKTTKWTKPHIMSLTPSLMYRDSSINMYQDAGKQFLALIIPKSWKFTILVEAHDKLGHQGNNHTYCLIKCQYYWKGMNKDIRKYIANCILCRQDKAKVQQYPLQMTEIPDRPFDKIAIDLVTDCETSTSGNKHILTIIDHLSGWPEAFPIPDKSAQTP